MAKRRVGVEYSPSMMEPVRPGAVSPERALCLPTFSHIVIVNKTSLSLSLSLSLCSPRSCSNKHTHLAAPPANNQFFFLGRIVVEWDSFLTLAFCSSRTKCDTSVCLLFIFKVTGVKPLVTSLCGFEKQCSSFVRTRIGLTRPIRFFFKKTRMVEV
jgi:hypothetical protein